MNYELVLNDLEKWQPDECFFRDYYNTDKSPESVQALLSQTTVDGETTAYAVHPETNNPNKTEDNFFASGRNVTLVKHPRYFPFFTHKHSFFEIIYVVSGHCVQVMDTQRKDLSEGDLCLLAPNITHGIEVFDDSIILNILIRHSTFMDIFLNTIRDKSQISLFFLGNYYDNNKVRYLLYHTYHDQIIQNYILDMYMEQQHLDTYSDRIICSLLTIFFTQLTRRHGKTVELSETCSSKSEYTAQLLSYIMTNYDTITLNELANHFHFSVPYCSKLVKTISGHSFSDLLTSVRLQQGENLLTHTQMSLADISDKIGYKNPETFIRCFNRFYEMTPSQFRKQHPHG